jgi:hypothetical protein
VVAFDDEFALEDDLTSGYDVNFSSGDATFGDRKDFPDF